jgi:tRNA-intron endonuclease
MSGSLSSSSSPYSPSLPSNNRIATNSSNNNDLQDVVDALLVTTKGKGNYFKVVVKEKRFQNELTNKGFGQTENSEFLLQPYEALYLLYTNRLSLKTELYKDLSFTCLLHRILKQDKHILTKFLVYRDLRSRGYIAKEGFGLGVDFRVYERGEFEKKPAKYVVFAVTEGTDIKAGNFSDTIEEIRKMGKFAVIAVIERRGEIIYYKASKMYFTDNKYHSITTDIQL